MPFIANTTIISNFAAVKRLDLLRSRFETLYISDHVFEEIQAGLLQGYTFYTNIEHQIIPFSDAGWIHLTALNTSAELQTFGGLLSTLHIGEASCLAIAFHRHWTLLSDDKTARKTAMELNVSVSGTLGVLLTLVHQHLLPLSEADIVLQQMIHNAYYSPITSLREILQE